MKPQLLKISQNPVQSFNVRHESRPSMDNKLHYHPEVELIYFSEGYGMQFIGDSITEFNSGDLVLIGSNLPHYWRYDQTFNNNDKSKPIAVKVAHFSETFLGEQFFNLPENAPLREILKKAKRGIRIEGRSNKKVAGILSCMLDACGADRIVYLITALLEISKCEELEMLSSVGYVTNVENLSHDRIKDVYEYTYANFRNKIYLSEIASIAKISPNSFCRYFKTFTKKTYSRFLNEVKVGQACKLLIDNKLNIKQVCFESGFNNFASFHKCFKDVTGRSPLSYQRQLMAS